MCKHVSNIYVLNFVHNGVFLQFFKDNSTKAVDTTSFEVIAISKTQVGGMAKILDTYKDNPIVTDSGKILMINKHNPELVKQFVKPILCQQTKYNVKHG